MDMHKVKKQFLNNKKLHLTLIILLTSLVYVNILQNDLVWDDVSFIEDWLEIRSLKNIPSFFRGALPMDHPGVYRPLRSLFYALSYKLWNQNPMGYHFQSILVHLACTILVYLITVQITKKNTIAFMTGILFGVHPIHTNAISFITSSFDQIGVIFFLTSFYFYLNHDKPKLYALSIFFFILALLTYELTITLPLVLILYDILFRKLRKEKVIEKVKAYAPFFLTIIIYMFIRFSVLKSFVRGGYLGDSFYLTMLTMSKVFVKYIYLLIFPVNLSLYHEIPNGISSFLNGPSGVEAILSQSIWDLDILLAIALLISLATLIIALYKKYPIISFCISWFFITLLPVSNILPIQTLLDEDFLYLPSLGFCLLFSFIINYDYAILKKKSKYLAAGLVIFFVFTAAAYSALTIDRNMDWEDSITLWSKIVEQYPSNALARSNLGVAYYSAGQLYLALSEYKESIRLNPERGITYSHVGVIYYELGQADLALDYFKKALAISPDTSMPYYDSSPRSVSKWFTMPYSVNSGLISIYINLGNTYLSLNETDKAKSAYEKAVSLDPHSYYSYYNLGSIYLNEGNLELAIENLKNAIALNPDYAPAYNNLGIVYTKQGEQKKAVELFVKALEIDPELQQAKDNLRDYGLIFEPS